ncbi:MAG: hypothetical protein EPN91_08410 [Salinibacterium sp.]|nr:MAG: hypothetical protein EPN91_08410 [Salinibacterium sp.]
MPTRPLLIGRGPWAQKLCAALPPGVQPTIDGHITCKESIREARVRGNDCIIIATSANSHYELLMLALEQKLPVFCEKPMVLRVRDAERVEKAWDAADRPPFLCDFVHLWSHGFEYAWRRFTAQGGLMNVGGELRPTPKFTAEFSGPVRRKDAHPVWDYGCHAIAMALMLGYDCRGLALSSGPGDRWLLENEHVEVIVNTNSDAEKRACVKLEKVFLYDGETWDFYRATGRDQPFKNSDAPPLQRALTWFLSPNRDVWRVHPRSRVGLWLPVQVTRVLESICSPESPFK